MKFNFKQTFVSSSFWKVLVMEGSLALCIAQAVTAWSFTGVILLLSVTETWSC